MKTQKNKKSGRPEIVVKAVMPKEVRQYQQAARASRTAFEKVIQLQKSDKVKTYLAAKEEAARPVKMEQKLSEDDYVLTNDEHVEMQELVFQIESVARIVRQFSFEFSVEPTNENMTDISLCLETIEEKCHLVQGLLDKRPRGHNKEEEKAA